MIHVESSGRGSQPLGIGSEADLVLAGLGAVEAEAVLWGRQDLVLLQEPHRVPAPRAPTGRAGAPLPLFSWMVPREQQIHISPPQYSSSFSEERPTTAHVATVYRQLATDPMIQ